MLGLCALVAVTLSHPTLEFMPLAEQDILGCVHTAYRPSKIKTPAAMARIAMITGRPEKLKPSNAISPVKMSQMLNKSIPRFLVSLILFTSFV